MDRAGNTIANSEIGRVGKHPLSSGNAHDVEKGSEDLWRWLCGPVEKIYLLATGIDSVAAMNLLGVWVG